MLKEIAMQGLLFLALLIGLTACYKGMKRGERFYKLGFVFFVLMTIKHVLLWVFQLFGEQWVARSIDAGGDSSIGWWIHNLTFFLNVLELVALLLLAWTFYRKT